jgi:hypothetical protein
MTDEVHEVRELSVDEVEAVSGGSQYPMPYPDGPFGPR